MDKLFLIIIISSAIIICLLIVNFLNDKKENFLNHGGFFINDNKYNNNEKEIKLSCGTKLKTSSTEKYAISNKEEIKLKNISKKIINNINKDLNLTFHLVELDFVTKQEFSDTNTRYLIEMFIYEIRYLYNRRIMLDIFIDNKNKKININGISILNSKEYKNKDILKLYNSDKKILGNHFQKPTELASMNNSSLEFNLLNYKPKHFNNKNFKQWILPKEYLTLLNKYSWPCKNQEEKWDENGINLTNSNNLKNCSGINPTFNKFNKIPKFLPNFKNIDANSDLNWLFGKFKNTGINEFTGGRG